MALSNQTPDFMDEVKNKVSGIVGTVDAIYTIDNIKYIDVKYDTTKMKYKSPLTNWVLVSKCNE